EAAERPAHAATAGPDDYWDGRFDVPGPNGAVNAVAFFGAYVYIGGSFTAVDGISSNHVARWDGAHWSALGSDVGATGNGVGGDVSALAVGGTSLYVGGLFTTAYNSASNSVGVNNIARWDGNTWSVLGGGGGLSANGVSGGVSALAISGTNT